MKKKKRVFAGVLLLAIVFAVGVFVLNDRKPPVVGETSSSIGRQGKEAISMGIEDRSGVVVADARPSSLQAGPLDDREEKTNNSASYWRPPQAVSWHINLEDATDKSVDAAVYDIDLFEVTKADIDTLHSKGRKVICYFSAGSFEPGRPDSGKFAQIVLGRTLEGWEDERWLDIRRLDVLGPLMKARLDTAKSKGCDAVDPDNVDAYTNVSGFPLKARDQLVYNRFIAAEAHERGLSVGLKNDTEQIEELAGDFDFAVNESCLRYEECSAYTPFVQAKKAVFHIEYEGKKVSVCGEKSRKDMNTVLKRRDLDVWFERC